MLVWQHFTTVGIPLATEETTMSQKIAETIIAAKMKSILDEERDYIAQLQDDRRLARDGSARAALDKDISAQLQRTQAQHDGFTSLLQQLGFSDLIPAVGEYPR